MRSIRRTLSLVTDAIARADDDRLTMVVLQIDSSRTIDTSVEELVRDDPPIAGPGRRVDRAAGSRGARRGRARAARPSHAAFAAPGSDLGPAHPVRLDDPDASSTRAGARRAAAPRERQRTRSRRRRASGRSTRCPAAIAASSGAIDGVRPTLGETIVGLDGVTRPHRGGRRASCSTAKVIGEGRDRRRQPNQDVVFDSLGIGGQLQHALLGPALAYFLFVAGLALIVFEFFAASVGFAAAVGGICVIGAGYGFAGLPVRWWAVGAAAARVARVRDRRASRRPRHLDRRSVARRSSAGSVFLYGGSPDLRPAWWLLALVVLGVALFYMFAIPPFIRARFSTPTIGREGMIGEMGTAAVAIDPDGVVEIRGARWRARTNRATPIGAGDPVRVVAVDGVVLEVEPETGGARDYRDRARRRRRRGVADANRSLVPLEGGRRRGA